MFSVCAHTHTHVCASLQRWYAKMECLSICMPYFISGWCAQTKRHDTMETEQSSCVCVCVVYTRSFSQLCVCVCVCVAHTLPSLKQCVCVCVVHMLPSLTLCVCVCWCGWFGCWCVGDHALHPT